MRRLWWAVAVASTVHDSEGAAAGCSDKASFHENQKSFSSKTSCDDLIASERVSQTSIGSGNRNRDWTIRGKAAGEKTREGDEKTELYFFLNIVIFPTVLLTGYRLH